MKKEKFGCSADGREVFLYTLTNTNGASAKITNYGGILVSLQVPNRVGGVTDVVLGYDSLCDYERADKYLGALVGRYCNRIAGARFNLNGKEYPLYANDHSHHLHGGKLGFDRKLWEASQEGESLVLRYTSADGEEGYPGKLEVTVTYHLSDANALSMEYKAVSDADTLCNLTNHSYFNLAGQSSSDILNQKIQLFADCYTPTDADSIPTGKLALVEETPLDLREPTRIGDQIDSSFEQIVFAGGYDHNFAVRGWDGTLRPMAYAFDEGTGITLSAFTTLPGVQFYSGNYLDGVIAGKAGASNGRRSGFCLESQFYPDSLAHANFPSPVLRKGKEFYHTTVYQFGLI